MGVLYDTIGVDYSSLRRPDPRIAEAIHAHLKGAASVLNVGAGAGSYEPTDLRVTAVEPSAAMIKQRPAGDAVVVQAAAEDLPFEDKFFDASMAILTVHHWSDVRKGLREMRRVTRGKIIILTFDPLASNFWLLDYLPELGTLDQQQMPGIADFEAVLGPVQRIAVPIPHDCTDGILCAYWRRPAAYLDPKVRRSMSSFWKIADVTEPLQFALPLPTSAAQQGSSMRRVTS
jgi:SAM-dependent methyltransferase